MIIIGDVIARLEDIHYINKVIGADYNSKFLIHFKNGEIESTKISYVDEQKLIKELKEKF